MTIDISKMKALVARVNDCTKPVDAADRNGILKLIDRVSACPVEQPAAAPIDDARFIAEHGHRLAQLLRIDAFDIADRDAQIMSALRGDTAPAPADERAAFEAWMQTGVLDSTPDLARDDLDNYEDWNTQRAWRGRQARACSANETEAV